MTAYDISHFTLLFRVYFLQSIGKIEKIFNHGNYYEAQQMYKSIGARLQNIFSICLIYY